jgi:hypothetical protein
MISNGQSSRHRSKKETELTILTSTRIYFPVGTVADAMNGPMVSLVHLGLLSAVKVVYTDPGVRRRTDDEAVAVDRVEGGRGDCVRKRY